MYQIVSIVVLAGTAAAQLSGPGVRQLLQTIGEMEGTLTAETSEFNVPTPAECTSLMAGCTGSFVTLSHDTAGDIEVIDDCTFRIRNWEFDGEGPAVEWWAATQSGDPEKFPYAPGADRTPAIGIKIGELGEPGNYVAGAMAGGSGDVTVRLGKDENGEQILLSQELDHISLWCEEFAVDFGNAALTCQEGPMPGAADAPSPANALSPTSALSPADSPSTADDTTPIDSEPAAAPDTTTTRGADDSTEVGVQDGGGAGSGTTLPSDSAPAPTDDPAHAVALPAGAMLLAAVCGIATFGL